MKLGISKYFTEKDIGKVFKKHGKVYKVVGYLSEPSVTFEEVNTGEQESHAAGCLNIQEFEDCTLEEYLDGKES